MGLFTLAAGEIGEENIWPSFIHIKSLEGLVPGFMVNCNFSNHGFIPDSFSAL